MKSTIRLKAGTFSDVAYVEGTYKCDRMIIRALNLHCMRYFDQKYRGVFFADDEMKKDIYQESFIALWNNIQNKKIYVEDGVLLGSDGEPFKCDLTSYFMSIAKFKYLELVRSESRYTGFEIGEFKDLYLSDILPEENDDEIKLEIIKYCLSHMPKGCYRILTLFYDEEKNLDTIMMEIPTFKSKNALKTAKHKCMENLRSSAKAIYDSYINV